MELIMGLEALEAQIKQDLQYLNLPITSWSLSKITLKTKLLMSLSLVRVCQVLQQHSP